MAHPIPCARPGCRISAQLLNTCGSCGHVVCDLHFFAREQVCVACVDGPEARR